MKHPHPTIIILQRITGNFRLGKWLVFENKAWKSLLIGNKAIKRANSIARLTKCGSQERIRTTARNLAVCSRFLAWLDRVVQQKPQMQCFAVITNADLTPEDSINTFVCTVDWLHILPPSFHQTFRNGFKALRLQFCPWNSNACEAVYRNNWLTSVNQETGNQEIKYEMLQFAGKMICKCNLYLQN